MTTERHTFARLAPAPVRALALAIAVGLGAAGCSTDVSVVAQRSDRIPVAPVVTTTPPPSTVPERNESIEEQPEVPVEPTDSVAPDTTASPELSPDDAALLDELQAAGFCDPVDVEDVGIVTAMHFVVAGQIQPPCYVEQPDDDRGAEVVGGEVSAVVIDDDPRLLTAWASLTAITPIELVDDISLVAGYEACSDCDTLAFVTTLDEDASFFLLAVDVAAGDDDPDELRLTMMHELSHVFNQTPGEQLVVTPSGAGCETFFNGSGCFTADSYMWAWIQEFWPPEELAKLPSDGSVDDDRDAGERCRLDAAYTGSYAAVHPEEDFAETFSAYVYDVVVDPALGAKLAFFDRYPEFVEIRENARSLGLAGTEANFDGCGF